MGFWDAKKRARFAEGRVGYAIGDIHGRADLLTRMFERLEAEPRKGGQPPIVVFLGDYIDRGPESAEVIELLLYKRPEGFEHHYLKGNHEEALLSFIADPTPALSRGTEDMMSSVIGLIVRPIPRPSGTIPASTWP